MSRGRSVTQADGSRYYSHPVTGEPLISVTTVLSRTDGKPHLREWHGSVAAEYAVDNLTHVMQVAVVEGRSAAVDLVKGQAKRLRNIKADAGTHVHDVQEALILWGASPDRAGSDIPLPTLPDQLHGALYDGEPIEDVIDFMVAGFIQFVADFDPVFEAAEMTVFNRLLKVAGTLDTILGLRGVALSPAGRLVAAPEQMLRLCVDTKTGRYLDATIPEQLAAYRRMREALMPMGQVVPLPPTDAGAVLHLRPEHADGYRLIPIAPRDDAHAWNRFRRAVELIEGRSQVGAKPGKVARPLRADGTVPAPLLSDLDGEGYGRVLGPLRQAGLTDLDEVASLTSAELLAVNRIGKKTADTVRQMLADHGRHLADESPEHEEQVA
ncbi:hypothetical protein GCM10023085_46020 [Actinomadura viridis]|uniref:Helix-hairpin-helix domain-containing protein n=1 Tax=Actinomadura viridis TaxID=58110 RepID=A0A931DIG6_9ACTN|nr:hypothetical protein [Actinomadura viridis]MBG6089962.1 hypothetical protein [Actinomadura viridis]